MQPREKPENRLFSSGPCAKRPGWCTAVLNDAALGRSHRSKLGKAKLKEVIDRSRQILGVPPEYHLGIVMGSDTAAVEMALWSLLGARGVDVLAWDSFGLEWVKDIKDHLGLDDTRAMVAEYGDLPDLSSVDFDRDVVFTWNGTTAGVKLPDGAWIADQRQGLTICDATSAVFAMELPWDKLDVVTYSWQKAMGGEAGHGVIVLSPRAVERLESYTPPWPLPKIFRLCKKGKLNEAIFAGDTINTPSMLCVEDALDGLKWAEGIGGLPVLIERSNANLAVLEAWVAQTPWIDFLAACPNSRSSTSICFKIIDPWYASLTADQQAAKAKQWVALLEAEEVAYDIGAYRDAPPGLRIWGGSTVEQSDIEALIPWLDWGFAQIKD
jgi:phosphoserine aminotransferase